MWYDGGMDAPFQDWMTGAECAALIGVNRSTIGIYSMRYRWKKLMVGMTPVYAREDVERTKKFLTDNVMRGRRPKNVGLGTHKSRRRQKSE